MSQRTQLIIAIIVAVIVIVLLYTIGEGMTP